MAEPVEWTETEWTNLLRSIKLKLCAPFIGSGASAEVLPTGKTLAKEWAVEHGYPFADRNLEKVAQYIAVQEGGPVPKQKIIERFLPIKAPSFAADPFEPHRVMAELGLPLYITTNYDDFMYRALQYVLSPDVVKRDLCPWHLAGDIKAPQPEVQQGTPESPLVFHLHGRLEVVDSIVITEDDYLDFMVNARRVTTSDTSLLVLPPKIDELLTQTSLLFVGYGLRDWNLRVLLRALVENVDRSTKWMGVSVQLEPGESEVDETNLDEAVLFLERYFDGPNLKVFWGDAEHFLRKVTARMKDESVVA